MKGLLNNTLAPLAALAGYPADNSSRWSSVAHCRKRLWENLCCQRRICPQLNCVFTLLLTVFALVPVAYAQRPPNVMLILADDLGWRDTSVYGSTLYNTPNIDRLARRGMTFTQAYAAHSSCSPTRASILTGLYPIRLGITVPACHQKEVLLEASRPEKAPPDRKTIDCRSVTRLKLDYVTLPESLKEAGYATGHFGKWHLGHEPYDPLHQGFDIDVPHWPGPGPAGSYVAPWKFPPSMGFSGQPGEHIEDRMCNEAIRFIQAHQNEPFYLNYWAFSVHSPYDAKPELVEKYLHRIDTAATQHNALYAAMVHSLDENVGRLLDTLEEMELVEQTILIFFSDNGGVNWPGFKNERQRSFGVPFDTPITSNDPLRSGKGSIYEGGTREPCIVVWPDVVPPGSKSDAVISSIDFYPTILEMLGLKPKPELHFDGISFVPALQGRSFQRDAIFSDRPHYVAVHEEAPASYVRQGDWKLIRFYCDNDDQTDRFELYNLHDDIGETNNLAATMPGKVRELDALIARHLRETGALTPVKNPNYRPAILGWRCGPDAHAVRSVEGLQMKCAGNDPQIMTGEVPVIDRPITFRVRMKSNGKGKAQVFWATAAEPQYHREASVLVDVVHDGQWHDYSASLDIHSPLTALRLDPAASTGEVTIERIRTTNSEGMLLKEWRFPN